MNQQQQQQQQQQQHQQQGAQFPNNQGPQFLNQGQQYPNSQQLQMNQGPPQFQNIQKGQFHHHQQIQQQILQQHPMIQTIKTEDVDIKPSIHELMAASNMEVDANTNNSDSNNVHGIVVTPEIVTMMTPTQMGNYQNVLYLFISIANSNLLSIFRYV